MAKIVKTPAPTASTTTPTTPVVKETAEETKARKRAAFAAYKAADEKFNTAKAALDAATKERSATVKAIAESFGKGPFNFEDRALQAVSRKLTDDSDTVVGYTWFFKTLGGKNIEDV
jgi:hypothetical protein